ncbi:MAG: EF-Tu/IF-2/RF-3 family GTPase [Candidatus Diapherotrites archaeon]
MKIDDVLNIKNVGIIVTGTVKDGEIKTGDTAVVNGKEFEVENIQSYKKNIDTAPAGIDIGIKLKAIAKEDVNSGDLLQVK